MKKKAVGCDLLLFDSTLLFGNGKTEPFPMAEGETGPLSLRTYMLSHPCPWNKIITKSLFTDHLLFFPEGILYEDLALIPALGAVAQKGIYYEKAPFHFYFQSENSIMRSPWSEKRLQIFDALNHLKRLTAQNETETEYLFFLHLYRSFVWEAFAAGDGEALKKASAFMKNAFPRWMKNPIVKEKASKKERLSALLFHYRLYFILRLLKGKKV